MDGRILESEETEVDTIRSTHSLDKLGAVATSIGMHYSSQPGRGV